MKVLKSLQALREWRSAQQEVALVPTMGNLHDGHLQLVKSALQHCDNVVVSIFVNPMQFGPNEDLDSYPRTLDADCAALEKLGVSAVFTPTVSDVYPRGLEQQRRSACPALAIFYVAPAAQAILTVWRQSSASCSIWCSLKLLFLAKKTISNCKSFG